LTSSNDITIYPRKISGNPKIELYEKNGTQKIAEFSSILDNEYNKIILEGLQGYQDTFDLKILDGEVEFDYILDPTTSAFADGLAVNIATTGQTTLTSLITSFPAGDNIIIAAVQLNSTDTGTESINAGNLKLNRQKGATLASNQYALSVSTAGTHNSYVLIAEDAGAPLNAAYNVTGIAGATVIFGGAKILALSGVTNHYFNDSASVSFGTTETSIATMPTSLPAGDNIIIASVTIDNGATAQNISAGNIKIKDGATTLASNQFRMNLGTAAPTDVQTILIIAKETGASANANYNITVTGATTGAVAEVKAVALQVYNSYFYDGGSVVIPASEVNVVNVSTTIQSGQEIVAIATGQFVDTDSSIETIISNNYDLKENNIDKSSNQHGMQGFAAYAAVGDGFRHTLLWRNGSSGTNPLYNLTARASATGLNGEGKILIMQLSSPSSDNDPVATLNSPDDMENLTSSSVSFNCSASDDIHLDNLTLYGNWSGGWHANETNSSSSNNSQNIFDKTLSEGAYTWNCLACDNASHCSFASANRTFKIAISYDDIIFNSSFDQGNLINITYISGNSSGYRYYTAWSNYTTKNFTDKHWWFYYSISNASGKNVLISINNLLAVDITGERWTNIEPFYSYDDNNSWNRIPFANFSCCSGNTFNVTINSEQDRVWIAPVPPYPVWKRDELIARAVATQYATTGSLGTLPAGQNLSYLTITDPNYPDDAKYKIYIIAQQHSGETIATYVTEGLINYLLDETDPTAAKLRQSYIFKIIPLMNPEGVYYGISRYTPFRGAGMNQFDLNRMWVGVPIDYNGAMETNLTFTDINATRPDAFIDLHTSINNETSTLNYLKAYYLSNSGTALLTKFLNNISAGRNGTEDYWPEDARGTGTTLGSAYAVWSRLGLELGTMMEHPHDSKLNSSQHPVDHNPQNITDWELWGKRIGIGLYDFFGDSYPNVTILSPKNNYNSIQSEVTFNCSASLYYNNLINITLYGDWSGGWNANETVAVGGMNNYTSFVKNLSDGKYIWNCLACSNHSGCSFASANYTLNVAIPNQGNQQPSVDDISTIPDQSITEASVSNVLFYATVSDPDGTSNISKVNASFSKSGQTTRTNATCAKIADLNETHANFSCGIGLWYWDGAGDWNVSVFAYDGINSSMRNETFVLLQTSAFVLSPSALTYPQINAGSENITSNNDPVLLNNTGNALIIPGGIEIKALDLLGQTNASYYIPAKNFSVGINSGGSPPAECSGTVLSNNSYVAISGAVLPVGNNSAGQGQEQLYYCLKQAPSVLSSQTYSTSGFGSWIVRITILAIAITPAVKKKKKNQKQNQKENLIVQENSKQRWIEVLKIALTELKENHSASAEEIINIVNKEQLFIPVSIFRRENKIGALESLCKYMKENLNLKFSEIARIISRDERTVWTAYKKATDKKTDRFEIKSEEIFMPLEKFLKEKTALASIILFLKDKHTNTEIARILNRDPRNIHSIYSNNIGD
jgi:hypothetical protein